MDTTVSWNAPRIQSSRKTDSPPFVNIERKGCTLQQLRGLSVNSTNALPCFDFFGCDCGHLGRSVDLVASLLVNLEFCRIRFWYPVAPGSGISREACRNHFWNLTTMEEEVCGAGATALVTVTLYACCVLL